MCCKWFEIKNPEHTTCYKSFLASSCYFATTSFWRDLNIIQNLYNMGKRLFEAVIIVFIFSLSGTKCLAQDSPLFKWAGNIKTTGGNAKSYGYGVAADASGNVYSTGSYNGTADFDPGAGIFNLTSTSGFEQDIYVSKLDANGNFVWAFSFGSSGRNDYGFAIAADASGNIYITGQFYGIVDFDPGAGVFALPGNITYGSTFILKLDVNGNFVWAKHIPSSGGNGSGRGIDLDNSGNVIIGGGFWGTVDFNPGAGVFNITSAGAADEYVVKLDTDGNFIWAKSMGGTGGEGAFALAIDNSNNVLTTGIFSGVADFDPGAGTATLTPVGILDIFVSKLDANGNFVWAKSMGGTSNDAGNSIATDNAGNVVITGYFNGTVDFDPGASTLNITSSGATDIFIVKLDANGNLAWANSIGGSTTLDDRGNGITIDALGNILSTGYFNGIADFDPGAGTFNLNSGAASSLDTFSRDIYQLKLDANGNFIWAVKTGSGNSFQPDEGNAITVDALGGINSTGTFSTSADFDFGPCTYNLIAAFNTDINAYVEKNILGPTYIPTVTLVSPSTGSAGTIVTLTGSGFSPILTDNVVRFGAGIATVTAGTSTSLTVIAPAGTGNNNVTVTIGCATSPLGPFFQYLITPTPTITSFTPTSGPVGATVTISGTNFSATPPNNTVKFNGTTAIVTASTTTSINTTVPSGAITGKITLTVSGKTATSASNFTVTTGAIPTITSITPTSGPIGTTVTITGTNFSTTPANNTVNFFDGIDSYVVSAVVAASTATSITTTVPSGASTGRIKVTTAGGSVTSAGNFTVTCGSVPTITSFSPTSGVVGTTVTIIGTNFSTTPSDNIVDFGGYNAIVTASTSTSITTTLPTGPFDFVPITITIACNTVTSSTNFNVICLPPPTITSFSPSTGAAGAVVTITGTNFSPNLANNVVDFNGEPAVVTASTFTSITTTVPANAFTGPINIYVGCDVTTSSTDFIVDCGPAPAITSFSPSNGLAGTVVTITGANFSTTPANNFVDFNGELTFVTASTATSITTTVPVAAVTGPITIVVDCNYVTSTTDFIVGNIISITSQPSDFIACVGQTATFTATATGATNIVYQWQFSTDGIVPYTDITNGGGYSNATTATLSVNTTGNFGSGRYRCRINGDFASEVITYDEGLFINSIPTAPTVIDASRCGIGSVTLTASGGSNGQYKWYSVATGGTAIAGEVNSNYITPSLTATTSYFVSISISGCESTRRSVAATINTLPTAPSATGGSGCLPNASVTLNASGGTNSQYRWYLVATGGTAINGETNSSLNTPALSATTTYYVSINNGTCESGRTSVVASLLPCTTPPTITSAPLSTSIGGIAQLNLVPLITTVNNPLNISSITVITQPPSGAFASILNGKLIVNYAGISFSGIEMVTVQACDANGNCNTQQFEIEVAGDVIVFNALSPYGENPSFVIQYIEIIPETKNNTVTIFDRWQNEVWKKNNYNNNSIVFAGVSDSGSDLPTGIYFYRIEFSSGRKTQTGFISLKR